ncbi:hypothetical protein [Roseibium polysiphoniae]|uniref:Uncharacterized protein n=1 Tax=Roseibium polysiphoniae TaxID=2571221 RepID=A0ABR9CAI3_9HYPH|nr:hypothetical protein [Roseibium polysiphoniae]MBD8876613.1 hypothetical protein [Roseibium polysiphoniae]
MTPRNLIVGAGGLLAGTFLAVSAQAATCLEEVEHARQALAHQTLTQDLTASSATVEVETGGKTVEVPAADAQPTESWFGVPPGDESVKRYLEAAWIAGNKGDEKACMEQLENAKAALPK